MRVSKRIEARYYNRMLERRLYFRKQLWANKTTKAAKIKVDQHYRRPNIYIYIRPTISDPKKPLMKQLYKKNIYTRKQKIRYASVDSCSSNTTI